jgi:hypothetical protein
MTGGVSWLVIAFALLLLAVGVMLVVILRVRTDGGPGTGVVRTTRVLAVLYVAVSGVTTIIAVARTLLDESVSVLLSVETFWPTLPAGVQVDGLRAEVTSGGFSEALVDVAGLDAPTRMWLAASTLVQGATAVIIGVVIIVLCSSLLRQDPFRAALPRAINISAIAIMVGGFAWQICGSVGTSLASNLVLWSTSGSIQDTSITYDDYYEIIGLPKEGVSFTLDFWPIGIGLVLFALAAAFRYGMKLQRDTDGLI